RRHQFRAFELHPVSPLAEGSKSCVGDSGVRVKTSVITAVYNNRETIADTVRSFQSQIYEQCEQIIVDGNSSDGTLEVLASLSHDRMHLVSEPDSGLYDALNKGINRAKGDIIGVLHSDDVFASADVLQQVANTFEATPRAMAVYGDLDYVSALNK